MCTGKVIFFNLTISLAVYTRLRGLSVGLKFPCENNSVFYFESLLSGSLISFWWFTEHEIDIGNILLCDLSNSLFLSSNVITLDPLYFIDELKSLDFAHSPWRLECDIANLSLVFIIGLIALTAIPCDLGVWIICNFSFTKLLPVSKPWETLLRKVYL